jgi:hypothetical protein
MTKASFPSDTVTLKEISTGGQYAGNGGSGYNYGDITSKPSISFDPSNKASGADVSVNTGDMLRMARVRRCDFVYCSAGVFHPVAGKSRPRDANCPS